MTGVCYGCSGSTKNGDVFCSVECRQEWYGQPGGTD